MVCCVGFKCNWYIDRHGNLAAHIKEDCLLALTELGSRLVTKRSGHARVLRLRYARRTNLSIIRTRYVFHLPAQRIVGHGFSFRAGQLGESAVSLGRRLNRASVIGLLTPSDLIRFGRAANAFQWMAAEPEVKGPVAVGA